MFNYGRIRSSVRPQEVEITSDAVYVAFNIEKITSTFDEKEIEEYEYNYIRYSKDEYIIKVQNDNTNKIAQLSEELQAAKIILGVE